MFEANVVYVVTAAVVAALVIWVAWTLRTAREPWVRTPGVAGDAPSGADPLHPDAAAAPNATEEHASTKV